MINQTARKFDKTAVFHNSKTDPHNALIFIHGGAWIDKTNTPQDFKQLCQTIIDDNSIRQDFSLYAIEYRLSPEVKHPIHLLDVLENIYQLLQQEQIDSYQILGHSVGATLAWQVATCNKELDGLIDREKVDVIRSKLTKCYLVDGIYSLKELLEEYPSYDYFVSQAFTNVDQFKDPQASYIDLAPHVSIHIVHSYKDELLSLRQPNYLISILQKAQLPYKVYIDDLGEHNQVYSHAKLSSYLINTFWN